jgi:hypothetical protein
MSMDRAQAGKETSLQKTPDEWTKLIQKLRWIGLEEEAQRLERAVSSLPPGERKSVLAGPFDTD